MNNLIKAPRIASVAKWLVTASAIMTVQTAWAQQPAAEKTMRTIEEVSVTAQRRIERSQDVPMSIVALNEDAIEKLGFTELGDIADKIPTLSIQPDFETSSALKVYIRGIGQEKPANFERDSGVGVYLDDVYVGHGNGLAGELNDIERIEVLAGPQGILYGRNTVGGAVKFVSKKPTGEFGFTQKLEAGSFGLGRSVTTVNFDEVANISSKITFLKSVSDGWVENTGSADNPGSKDATGYRIALQWAPTDSLVVDYSYDDTDQEGVSNYQQHGYPMFAQNLTALPTFSDRQDKTWRPLNEDLKDDFESSGHALTALWDISENMTLKSITGYREFESELLHDGAESYNVSTFISRSAEQDQFSQEFLLSGFTDDGGIKYHLGVYYFDESAEQLDAELVSNYGVALNINNAILAGAPIVGPTLSDLNPYSTFKIANESSAIYSQITWVPNILEQRLTIDVGARYTEDKRSLAWNKPILGPTFKAIDDNSVTSHSFDPAFTVDYAFTDDIHAYFRYAQAYRSGGFDSGTDRLQAFEPEDVESYEIGLKSKMLDNRLQVNMAIFELDYTDIQVQFFDPGLDPSAPPAKVTVNAAEANTKGAEIDIKYIPFDALVLSAGGAYLDSETTVANPFTGVTADRPLFNTPELKYNLSAEYTFDPLSIGTVSAIVSYDFRDEELAAGASDETDLKPSYDLVGARITLSEIPVAKGDLTVALVGNNLLDEEYEVYHNFGSVVYGEPRNYSVSLSYRY